MKLGTNSMLWHIVVSFEPRLGKYEILPSTMYVVHILSDKKHDISQVFDLAKISLLSIFRELMNSIDEMKVFIGYEFLPIDVSIDGPYFAVVKLKREIDMFTEKMYCEEAVSNVPQSVVEAVENYRKTQITLYYSHVPQNYDPCYENCKEYRKARIIDVLKNYPEAKIYEIHDGYNVRIKLNEPVSLKEIFVERCVLHDDDNKRVEIEGAYLDRGLGFLTNYLFNEICLVDKSNNLQCYVEREIDPSELYNEFRIKTMTKLPPMKITTDNGEIIITKGESENESIVIFKGYFGLEEIVKTVKQIESGHIKNLEQSVEKKKNKLKLSN